MNRKIKNNKLLFLKLICMMFTIYIYIYIYIHTHIYIKDMRQIIYIYQFLSVSSRLQSF